MKTKNALVQILLVVFTIVSVNVWAGNEDSGTSKYKISPDQGLTPASGFVKGWEIAYGESSPPVHVYLKETKKGQEYLVRTKYFEVKYLNGDQGFGVRLLNPSEVTVSESLNATVLNQTELKSQKCINSQAIASEQVLETIAGYLPDLINEQYKSILN